jgi:hypothetical protein
VPWFNKFPCIFPIIREFRLRLFSSRLHPPPDIKTPRNAGLFYVWRRERVQRSLTVRQTSKQFGPPPAPRRGSKREMQSRLGSIPHSLINSHRSPQGFFWSGGERCSETPTVRQTAKQFGPENAPERRIGSPHRAALPAYGTSMCLIAF